MESVTNMSHLSQSPDLKPDGALLINKQINKSINSNHHTMHEMYSKFRPVDVLLDFDLHNIYIFLFIKLEDEVTNYKLDCI